MKILKNLKNYINFLVVIFLSFHDVIDLRL